MPTVESEAKSSTWAAYFIILALVVLAMVGIFVREMMTPFKRGDVEAEFRGPCCCVSLLMVTLPFLILYPVIRTWSRLAARTSASTTGWSSTKNIMVILGLLILLPFALYILTAIVCTAL